MMRSLFIAGGGLVLLFSTSCLRTTVPETTPLTEKDRRILAASARDPRNFWINVYESDQGPIFEGAFRFTLSQSGETLLRKNPDGPAPVLDAGAGSDNPHLALLDSSSPDSWVTLQTFVELDMALLGPPYFQQIPTHLEDESLPGYLAVADPFTLAGAPIQRALLYVQAARGPFGTLARENTDAGPSIVVGNDILQRLGTWRLDLQAGTFAFARATPLFAEPEAVVGVATIAPAKGALAVRGRINGREQTLVLDTAGDYALVLPNRPSGPIQQLEMGSLVLRNVSALTASEAGLSDWPFPRVGLRLLNRFSLLVDAQSGRVTFERPAP